MAITYRGKRLTAREQKAKVIEWAKDIYGDDWNYRKEYDALRFKARAYERATGEPRINVADLLANEIRRQTFGEGAHKSTSLYTAVQSAPTVTTTRKITEARIKELHDVQLTQKEAKYKGWLQQEEFRAALGVSEAVSLSDIKAKLTASEYETLLEAAKENVWLSKAGTMSKEELKEWRKQAFQSP